MIQFIPVPLAPGEVPPNFRGDDIPWTYDSLTGRLLVNAIGVSDTAKASQATDGTVKTATYTLPANPLRKGFYVQNLGTTTLSVEYGTTGTATHVVLSKDTLQDAGNGGWRYVDDYAGAVQVRALVANTNPRFLCWEAI